MEPSSPVPENGAQRVESSDFVHKQITNESYLVQKKPGKVQKHNLSIRNAALQKVPKGLISMTSFINKCPMNHTYLL